MFKKLSLAALLAVSAAAFTLLGIAAKDVAAADLSGKRIIHHRTLQ